MGILFGASGCLLTKPGITKLSELQIDADKDWQGYGVTNLKELASGMQRGDVVRSDGVKLVKLSPGTIGNELTVLNPEGIGWEAPPSP